MGKFADWLLGPVESNTAEPETRSQTAWFDPRTLSANRTTPYGRLQTDLGNLSLVAIYRSVSMIADLTATLPFVAERLEPVDPDVPIRDRTWERLERQPPIVAAPDPLEAQDVTIRKIATYLALRGNAYLVATMMDPQTGRPISVRVAKPSDITIGWDDTRTRAVVQYRGNTLARDQYRHLKFLELPDAVEGLGPLQAASSFIGGALAADEFARRLFSDGSLPGGVISSPTMLTEDEARALKTTFIEANEPLSREPAVLSGGATYTNASIKPEEAQFIETRGFGVEQVAAMFGIDPYLLAHQVPGSSLVYRNVAGLFGSLLRTTLEPQYLSKIENAFSSWLPMGQRARFNTDEFLRTDPQERYTAYQIGIASRFITPNEARRAEGLPPIPGGDEFADTEEVSMVDTNIDEGDPDA